MTRAATYVPPKGPKDAWIAFVGEQPGRNEVIHRQLGPFSGPAGRNLQECLRVAGIDWSQCYRTNVIKDLDHPLAHYIEIRGGRHAKASVHEQGEQYISELREELRELSPRVVVACGNVALYALCSRIGITTWRGSILESTLVAGLKVVPTIHPATWTQEKVRVNPDAYLNRYLVTMDLKRVAHEQHFPSIQRVPRELVIAPSYYQCVSFIDECTTSGDVVDYDIEIQPFNQELSCIGLAHDPYKCVCIPFVGPQGDYFTAEQELDIMLMLEQLFNNPGIKKRGQNVIFDSHYLLRKYGIRTYNLECTMVAQGILYPELRKGLDFITAMWTDIPYYKRDGKIWLEGGSDWRNGWEYNCLDVLSCAEAHPKQLQELSVHGNLPTYERQRKLIEPLTYMMERGILVDKQAMAKEADRCEQQIDQLTARIHKQIGRDLNLNSPQQLCEYFYAELGLPVYKNPNTGKPTTDVTALTRIANKGYPIASQILKVRQLAKRKSTFLDTRQIDQDGRMRCQYNPVGTKFGRISSSENIFGTGTNLQNQPHDVLTFLIADPGYVVYSIDMSQIENRIVAYVGNIPQMIEAFEHNIDVHRLTAAMTLSLLGQPRTLDQVSNDERQDFGKRPNHAFNYGYGYRSYSLKYEVPERDAKRIYEAYHSAYPALRNGYWGFVQKALQSNRVLTNLMDRHIQFLGLWSDKLLHEAYSAIPQSTCGDLVNEHGIEFIYYNDRPHFRSVELLTQVHDSIEFQMPLSVPLSTHARVLLDIRASLERPLEFMGRSFSVPADLTVGKCLNKDVGIELKGDAFPRILVELEDALYQAIDQLGLLDSNFETREDTNAL